MFVPVITLSIARIIDYSFSTTGNFPHRWKPLKLSLCSKGDASDPSSYRPISVLTVLSRVVERYVHDFLYEFLEVNNLIYYLVTRAFP